MKQTAIDFTKAVGVVLAIAFVDAVIGGAISAGLWTSSDVKQAVNDAWQLMVALTSIFVLLVIGYFRLETAFAAGILLMAYCEDTLYYVLLWVSKPIVTWFFHGVLLVKTGIPAHIGGWLGWISRFFEMVPSISLKLWVVLLFNVVGLIAAWWAVYVENNK